MTKLWISQNAFPAPKVGLCSPDGAISISIGLVFCSNKTTSKSQWLNCGLFLVYSAYRLRGDQGDLLIVFIQGTPSGGVATIWNTASNYGRGKRGILKGLNLVDK